MLTVILLYMSHWINITINNCTYVVIGVMNLVFFLLVNEFIAHICYLCRFLKIKCSFIQYVLFLHFPLYLQDRTVYPLD